MIKEIYKFKNGMMMVFDEQGKQICELQGLWPENKERLIDSLKSQEVPPFPACWEAGTLHDGKATMIALHK